VNESAAISTAVFPLFPPGSSPDEKCAILETQLFALSEQLQYLMLLVGGNTAETEG